MLNSTLKKYLVLNGIRTLDFCDTTAVLYQLSYQANRELVTLRVRNIPVEGEEYKWIYERSDIWTAGKDVKILLIIAVPQNVCNCESSTVVKL